ncbi:hypothetical protein HY638_00390 [Candidatus Woesearchaeota archaeon]|nr:hypothetical protein [Candidatus Woesearchaeota archaeon]
MTRAEIDISNQINNSWQKSTVLAMVQGNLKYSVMLRVEHKDTIRKFCEDNTPSGDAYKASNRDRKRRKLFFNRAISLTHAYLVWKILLNNEKEISKVQICSDTPPKFLDNALQRIIQNTNTGHIIRHISRGYGLEKNNSAQKYAKAVARGDTNPTYILTARDVGEIIALINKFVPKK